MNVIYNINSLKQIISVFVIFVFLNRYKDKKETLKYLQ